MAAIVLCYTMMLKKFAKLGDVIAIFKSKPRITHSLTDPLTGVGAVSKCSLQTIISDAKGYII